MELSETSVVKAFLLGWQEAICQMLCAEDPTLQMVEDRWNHSSGGGGTSRAFTGGKYIEKAGVNFSQVQGEAFPASATVRRPELAGHDFTAMGVSLVIHPCSPFAPTTHANLRLFTAGMKNGSPVFWFGGGFDLTPYYGFVEDCVHWHHMANTACKPFGEDVYPKFKQWADDYFYLKHRQEPRGIGGLFFDDLAQWGMPETFTFIESVAHYFIQAYQPILARRKKLTYTEAQRHFQCYRRGRYVEFNLLYDRGTLFGLQSGGRTESILMSLPPQVIWQYNWHPTPGSKEAELTDYFLKPRDWLMEK